MLIVKLLEKNSFKMQTHMDFGEIDVLPRDTGCWNSVVA